MHAKFQYQSIVASCFSFGVRFVGACSKGIKRSIMTVFSNLTDAIRGQPTSHKVKRGELASVHPSR